MRQHTIVHITDPHLSNTTGAPENPQKRSPAEKLNQVFADIQVNVPEADFIVITGDLVHEGNAEDYRRLRVLLDAKSAALNLPIHVLLGNHDRTAAFFGGYLNQNPLPQYDYYRDYGDYDAFFLDSKDGDREAGILMPEQLLWLQTQLATGDKPALIFLHHPPYAAPLGAMQYSVLQNGDELAQIVAGSRATGVFSGHIHFPVSYVKKGCLFATADSTAYHIDCRDIHNHSLSDATSYSVITMGEGVVGSEIRLLRHDDQVLAHIPVGDVGFVK
ncbi:metallophosphoesterase family protein [Lacticaseibacillus sp. GG6-2]